MRASERARARARSFNRTEHNLVELMILDDGHRHGFVPEQVFYVHLNATLMALMP